MKEKAQAFAEERHKGQVYNGLPYAETHLPAVVRVLADFGFTSFLWVRAGWLHDTVEDTKTTLEELRAEFGSEVAELVWAVTGVGATRKERNREIYRKIGLLPLAAILKCADRITHFEATQPGSSFHQMYMKEMDDFRAAIAPHVPEQMWARLERAAKGEKPKHT